jgi:hypothetical protein
VTQQRKAQEALPEKRAALLEKKKAGLLVLQNVCGGYSIEEGRLGGCEKSRFNLF